MNQSSPEAGALGGLPLTELLDRLAEKSPVPGGGSVAGITTGLAAGLGGMVVAYSLGKSSLSEHQSMLETAAERLQRLRGCAVEQADADAAAYRELNTLWRLDEDDPARIEGFADAVRGAIEAPGAIMHSAREVLDCLRELPERSARHLRSDLAIAVELACTGGRAAERNVSVNLPLVEDETLREELDARYGTLGAEIDTIARGIIETLS
ncbi:MAG: cyclodeaminase/cyclohydrolase family protein [Planctomycetota bacterium]|nr:cyclodeaminase/cyclohydrolase family protein [Planctomycetota bacterium]